MKILAYDIEASALNADFGLILTFGSKFVGEGKVEVLRNDDYPGKDIIARERNLLIDISAKILEADALLGHYSNLYDYPFINSRLIYHKLPVLPPSMPQLDTWKVARYRLKLHNNRLNSLSTFLGTEEEKNAIKPEQWIRALSGHRPSMDYIVEHNRRDVVVLEESYLRIRALITDHPNKGLVDGHGGCSVCGSLILQKRGFHITRTRKYQRFQCQNCGGWSKGAKPIEIAKAA